jgi:hypothetical protein
MKVVETFYTDKLKKQREGFEKKIKMMNKERGNFIEAATEKSELEKVFVNAMDEVRK